jgi:branched-chain amino acid transport system permease protein
MQRNTILTLAAIVVLVILLFIANNTLDSYVLRVLNLCAIYTVLGLSMNLINGFTGLFSLGHAGFMAVGAYVTALLTMSIPTKQMNFFLAPMISPLDQIVWPFLPSLILAGVLSAIVAYIVGAPVLRLKGDYLAIATLGFAEIIRVIFTNTQRLTNGALGLKGIPASTNLWWTFGTAVFTIFIMVSLINSSYGRAFKAIREDEIAAESMGISLYKHKVLSFAIGAFFAGVGGGLLGSLIGAVDPLMFRFFLTFNILLIIVLGGMGSITGTVISAFVITIAQEVLRFLDEPMFASIPALPGLRMVVFSALLMIVVLFFRHGLMGTREFSWDKLFGIFSKKPLAKGGSK